MPPTTTADGSEDVNDFLMRIRELGEKRDKEDEERTKKLEEDILQSRRERQARRAGKQVAIHGFDPRDPFKNLYHHYMLYYCQHLATWISY